MGVGSRLRAAFYFITGLLLVTSIVGEKCEADDVVWIINSQPSTYHQQLAKQCEKDILEGILHLIKGTEAKIVHAHRDLHHEGSWTYLPILQSLRKKYEKAEWFVFVEENTFINAEKVVNILEKHTSTKPRFIGHALFDEAHTIIHHFREPRSLNFPDTAAGFALNSALIKKLVKKIKKKPLASDNFNFAIDSAFELALYASDLANLTHEPGLCNWVNRQKCATYPRISGNCKGLHEDKIFYAVKTFHKNHDDRVVAVQESWHRYTKHVRFYSDEDEPAIPTYLTGVPNTELGHCSKMKAIIDLSLTDQSLPPFSWLAIVDDDTILSSSRVSELLSCYDASRPIVVGQRYGFRVASGSGYNYPTGGAGMFLSRAAVESISGSSSCECPSAESPDDMTLGAWLQRLHIPLIHSSQLHQARPDDYPTSLLLHQRPATFHKHWMINPVQAYNHWFKEEDEKYKQSWTAEVKESNTVKERLKPTRNAQTTKAAPRSADEQDVDWEHRDSNELENQKNSERKMEL